MTQEKRLRVEARLAEFEKNADKLWALLNDPAAVARHLVQLLEANR